MSSISAGAVKIALPTKIDDETILPFVSKCILAKYEKTVILDFTYISFAFAAGCLILAEFLKRYYSTRKSEGKETVFYHINGIEACHNESINYLRYFGFFAHIGLPIGRENAELNCSRYVTIQVLDKKEIKDSTESGEWHERLVSICDDMVRVISSNAVQIEALSYCFREAVRNAFEHSGSSRCSVIAQRYPALGFVEIGISDFGVGIHETIKPVHNTVKPIDSIRHALRPGVSSKLGHRDDEWGNSGFGLYVLSSVCSKYGYFSINSSGIHYKMASSITEQKSGYLKGTSLALRLKIKNLDYFQNIKADVIREGEEKALMATGKARKASKSS